MLEVVEVVRATERLFVGKQQGAVIGCRRRESGGNALVIFVIFVLFLVVGRRKVKFEVVGR